MKKLKILLLLLIGVGALWAQSPVESRLRLVVVDASDNSPIPDVVCRVLGADGQMLSYALTDGKGVADLATERGVEVSFALINYARVKLSIVELRQMEGRVSLSPQAEQLREVQVNIPPIRKDGDTLRYNAGSFVGKEDKYLEDLLRKLPGITISKSGHISYQGEPISKFYIEGQDLMGYRYNQATRNMSVDAVAQVQVLENHQSIRSLKGKVFTDKAAINIRLKDSYKLRPFGEVTLGGGLAPSVWNNRLFTALIGRKNQMMITAKMNNDGTDLSSENTEHTDLFNGDIAIEPSLSFVSQGGGDVPYGMGDRALFNNAKVVSISDLQRTSSVSHLRLNLSGYWDRLRRQDHSVHRYGGPASFDLDEKNTFYNRASHYHATLLYEHNSDENYFSNDLSGSLTSDSQDRETLVRHGGDLTQSSLFSSRYVQNTFQGVFSWGQQTFSIKSRTRLTSDEDGLGVQRDSLGSRYEVIAQRLHRLSWVSKNTLNTSVPIGRSHRVGLEGFVHLMRRSFGVKDSPQSQVSSRVNDIELGVVPSYIWRFRSSSVSVSMPMGYHRMGLDMGQDRSRREYWFVEPKVEYSYRMGPMWSGYLRGSYRQSPRYENFYTLAPLYRDYRNKYVSPTWLGVNSDLSFSSSLRFKDLAEMLFAHLSVVYNASGRGTFRDVTHRVAETMTSSVQRRQVSHSLFVMSFVDKTFVDLGLGLRASCDYNWSYAVLSRSGEIFGRVAHVWTPSLEVSFRKWEPVLLSYVVTAPIAREESRYSTSAPLVMMDQHLQCLVALGTRWKTGLKVHHLMTKGLGDKYEHRYFGDLSVAYEPSKRVELNLALRNVWGSDTYVSSGVEDVNYYMYRLPLRPREFMLSCLFRF